MLPEAGRSVAALTRLRHFFRHAYGVALDPVKVERELERAERMAAPIDRALSEVDEYLADAVRVLRSQED